MEVCSIQSNSPSPPYRYHDLDRKTHNCLAVAAYVSAPENMLTPALLKRNDDQSSNVVAR